MPRIAILLLGYSSLLLPAAMNPAPAAETTNEVLVRLLAKGGLRGAADSALPKPTMTDGLDQVAQRAVVAGMADANHPIEALERKPILFDEPVGWFNGANLLRSKLPIVVQEGVRKFRPQLAHDVSQAR